MDFVKQNLLKKKAKNDKKLCSDDTPSVQNTPTFEEEEEAAGEQTDLSSTHDSEILRYRSRGTLNSEFFDNLWPLILKENICEVKSKHHRIFQPYKTFDDIWAHTLLAEKSCKDYAPPVELRCFKEKRPEDTVYEREVQTCVKVCLPRVETLTEQLEAYQRNIWLGQYHSYRFVTRLRPWYLKQTIYDKDFEITDEMLAGIKGDFDKAIVESIIKFNCKLIVIDMGTDVPIGEMEHWLPFCKFVKLLVVSHDPIMSRKLRILGDIFIVIDFEENLEATWQEDLDRSLHFAFKYACDNELLDNLTKEFIFAFSKGRGFCKIDTFEAVERDLEDWEKENTDMCESEEEAVAEEMQGEADLDDSDICF